MPPLLQLFLNKLGEMKMKKYFAILTATVMVGAGMVMADWTGTKVGPNTLITDGVAGAIAIGNGATGSLAQVTASGAVQIGGGSNGVANTMQFQNKKVLTEGDATLATFAGALTVTGTTTLNGAVKVGAQTGWTGVITNKMSAYTNLTWVGNGVITNVTLIGALP